MKGFTGLDGAGLYWAKSVSSLRMYDCLVSICGEAPMLYLDGVIDIDCMLVLDNKTAYHQMELGPKLDIPERPPMKAPRNYKDKVSL